MPTDHCELKDKFPISSPSHPTYIEYIETACCEWMLVLTELSNISVNGDTHFCTSRQRCCTMANVMDKIGAFKTTPRLTNQDLVFVELSDSITWWGGFEPGFFWAHELAFICQVRQWSEITSITNGLLLMSASAARAAGPIVIFTIRNEVVKVMFLHMSVILFTGGVCRSTCWNNTPSPLEQAPPEQEPPPSPPSQMATVADGTHPTGMHYCGTKNLFVVAPKLILTELLHKRDPV